MHSPHKKKFTRVSATFKMLEHMLYQYWHTNCVAPGYLLELRKHLARVQHELYKSGRTWDMTVDCAMCAVSLQLSHVCENYSILEGHTPHKYMFCTFL